MNRFLNAVIYSSVIICSSFQASEGLAQNADGFNDQARVKTAIELIKIACVTGEKLDIEITGDGGLSFLKRGVSGAVKVSKEEINGVVKGANQVIASEDNEKIRKCMQQYVPKILDKLLEPRTASVSSLSRMEVCTEDKETLCITGFGLPMRQFKPNSPAGNASAQDAAALDADSKFLKSIVGHEVASSEVTKNYSMKKKSITSWSKDRVRSGEIVQVKRNTDGSCNLIVRYKKNDNKR